MRPSPQATARGCQRAGLSRGAYAVHGITGALLVLAIGIAQHVFVLGVSVSFIRLSLPVIVGGTAGLLIAHLRSLNERLSCHMDALAAREAEIGALNDELERRVEERTAKLQAAEAELHTARRMDSLGRLAGGVAHDMNNILTCVTMPADELLEVLPSGGAEAELLAEIQGAAERGTQLVRQLLTFARESPGEPVAIDVNAVIEESRGMLERLLERRVRLVVELAEGPLIVKVDRGQLQQVIVNLVVNARDAMPEGGTVRLATGRRDGGSLGVRGQITIEVVDEGVGMSPEVRERVFEAFYTTKGERGGTGMGLASVHGIVTSAGGRVEVTSELGRGAAFTVRFPEVPAPTAVE